jgi:hypothetical protein
MRDQDVLEAIHTLNLRSFGIYPIYLLKYVDVGKSLLVFRTEIISQINTPIAVVQAPPVEVDMVSGLQGWFDQTRALDFDQITPPPGFDFFEKL